MPRSTAEVEETSQPMARFPERSYSHTLLQRRLQIREKTRYTAGGDLVEVASGVHEQLRGANETKSAIEIDYVSPAMCSLCSETIFFIKDAKYVVCPGCLAVTPTEQDDGFGLALGCNLTELYQIQRSIGARGEKANCL